jgi:hypothetical protein
MRSMDLTVFVSEQPPFLAKQMEGNRLKLHAKYEALHLGFSLL